VINFTACQKGGVMSKSVGITDLRAGHLEFVFLQERGFCFRSHDQISSGAPRNSYQKGTGGYSHVTKVARAWR
jgi:hypothetical protein